MSTVGSVARLVDARRLRAIALAVRRDVDDVLGGHDHEPDPALVDLVADPYESLPGAHDRLRELEAALRERGDRRAIFLTIYTHMTRAVREAIERGVFADPAWMRRYTETFADYYRRAFLAYERGDLRRVPDPWRIAFGVASGGDGLVVQDALLGINAHINYDLALTLDDVGIDPRRREKYADHRAINDILARLVDAQQVALAELYAPGVEDIDATFGGFDESFSLFTMEQGREQAWRVAVVTTDVRWSPVEAYARWVLSATATGGALFVLAPTVDPAALDALERVERRGLDLDAVTARMRDRLAAVEF